MKSYKYLALATLALLMLSLQSCFQDMDNDPSFDYPDANEALEGKKGESFYLPFEDDYIDQIYSFDADKIGVPSFAEGKVGKAYAGATDSYISFLGGAVMFKKDFSIAFWYKLNPVPDRAGIITLSPPRKDNKNDVRTSGLRLLREEANMFKLSVGDGAKEYWIGGNNDTRVVANEWTFITVTLSETRCFFYINGEKAASLETGFPGISWQDVNTMSIGSGAPLFIEWKHFSDLSLIDELRIFNKELSQAEVKSLMAD